jgi:hypothetical protein
VPHEQWPPLQVVPPAQTTPQPPQLFGSVCVSTQALAQSAPVPQVATQVPAEQT